MMLSLFHRLQEMITNKHSGALGVVVQGTNPQWIGKRFLVDSEGELLSSELPDSFYPTIKGHVLKIYHKRTPEVITDEKYHIFVDPIYPNPHLIVLGGGHIALPLVKMAKVLGYEITVIDDRIAFANTTRFPEADHVLCESFDKALKSLNLAPNSYVVIITRGHKHDKTSLGEILRKPTPAYIGMIGSRRKVRSVLEELEYEGFNPEQLKHVYAPIGLDIGAQTPEEIALSILAEMTMVNHYGKSNGLKIHLEG